MTKERAYYVETRWGGSEDDPPPERLREIIAELDIQDEEHPDTWLGHLASGCLLRLDEDRYAHLHHPKRGIVAHLAGVSAELAWTLWLRFSQGGPDAVSGFEWITGPRPVSEREIAERARRATQAMLTADRAFYDALDAELPDTQCRTAGCPRGRIQYSVLCKVHHFERIRGRPCPFTD